jgi:DNA adenine methylase
MKPEIQAVPEMKITALAPWFGSKRNLALEISALLGKHSSYFEPFCGSMAVLLQKPASSHENVNDLHGDLINMALVVADTQLGSKLFRMLRRTMLHEDLHALVRERMLAVKEWDWRNGDKPDVQRAYDYFVFSWIGRNGTAGTNNVNSGFCHRWTPHGGHGGQRFASAIESIPAWRKRIRRATITRMDGFEFLGKVEDCEGTSIYVDPPYFVKGAKYVHDFAPEDHERLAKLLHRFTKARVVLSYYDDPKLTELYPDWTQYKIEVSKALAHQGARGENNAKAIEVLLVNEHPNREAQQGLFGPEKP